MMYGRKELRIKDELIVDGILRIFEEKSQIAKSLKNISLLLKRVVIVGIIYFLIICYIQRYVLITLLFVIGVTLTVIGYLIKKSAQVLYSNSDGADKKLPNSMVHINENLDVITYHLKSMKKEEMRLLREILRVNNLEEIESIKELKNYYTEKKNKKTIDIKDFVKDILSLYIIPITFGIINIYTAIDINLGVESDIINIAYIIFSAFVILSIVLIVYLIFEIRKFSTTNYYAIPRLENLLLEIILQKNRKKRKKKYDKKSSFKRNNEKIQIKRRNVDRN